MENNIADIHERVYAHLVKDTSLRFTLRQVNRAGRMDAGYWFSGNENYLAFSFWKGLDWKNKTPNIYFQVNLDGSASLNFVSYDNDEKIKFFSNVSEALDMRQLSRTRTEETFEHWQKVYRGNDYLASLDSFLKKDKRIIDAFLKSSEGMEEVFGAIDETEFNKSKLRIEKIRRKLQKNETYKKEYQEVRSIKLDSMKLEHLSLFGTPQEIHFHPNLTCIIGENGTGKTTILRALVLSFMGYEQNETIGLEDNELLTGIIVKMKRIEGLKDGRIEYTKEQGTIDLLYSVESANGALHSPEPFRNSVFFQNTPEGPKISDDPDADFRNVIDDRFKSLFLAFPQVLGLPDEAHKLDDTKEPHAGDAISMLNNQPDNRLLRFGSFLRKLNAIANDKQAKGANLPKERLLLGEIFKIISEVLLQKVELHSIEVNGSDREPIWVRIGENGQPILLELVSSGYNNVFGWMGYLLKRLIDVTPEGEDFKKTHAIVLVDEIDTYLHPVWQSRALRILMDTFPNVQFIVTTHSPYVVGSIPNDRLRIYVCKTQANYLVEVEEFTEFNTYGANLDRLSAEVFGTPGRFVLDIQLKMGYLSNLIDSGQLAEAKNMLVNDFREIDRDDPELTRKRTLIKTKELLAQ